jgi:hypothetical protein
MFDFGFIIEAGFVPAFFLLQPVILNAVKNLRQHTGGYTDRRGFFTAFRMTTLLKSEIEHPRSELNNDSK